MTIRMEHAPETGMRWHPYAELFPWIEGQAFDEFKADVAKRGVIEPVVMFDGQLLDGRNRYMAARDLGIEYPVTEYAGDDPLGFVLSKNLSRRHLTDDQRRMVAARLVNMKQGRPSEAKTSQIANITREQAAESLQTDVPGVDRARAVLSHAEPSVVAAVDQGQISVSAASTIAKLPQGDQPAALEKALPNGARAIMGSRTEPTDGLDFFPTPPWATRALIERVFPHLKRATPKTIWEPACGEGHIAEVLEEYGETVFASDVHDYGYGDFTSDFLGEPGENWPKPEWIITNPPFGDRAEKFVLRALNRSTVGVAMFFRVQWLDTIGRYERVFKDDPPTLMSFFAERVNLCRGRWDPEGSTATAYMWLVWLHGEKPRAPFWIPPGCRDALSKPDDAVRFTAHPVKKREIAQAAE
jgi:hypothetical protein